MTGSLLTLPAPAPGAGLVAGEQPPRRVTSGDPAERSLQVACGVAALAADWLLYERVAGWSGRLGFVLLWYATFLLLYGFLSAQRYPAPIVRDRLASALITGGACVVGGALLSTGLFVAIKAAPALGHLDFFTRDMSGVRPTASLATGGVLHAIVGTGLEIALAVAVSLPLGIGTAVYLTEVRGRIAPVVRTVVEAMTALPDILAGLFVYTVLIIGLHWPRTGLAAALALAVTMIPIVARSAEVVLRVVPGGLREAALALGASQWQTVRRVVLPTARAGLATSMILGVARIAGETAPLLIVSGASTFFNADPVRNPMNSLPLFIFSSVRSGEPRYIARGYGAAALLLLLVLVLFVFARLLTRDRSRSR